MTGFLKSAMDGEEPEFEERGSRLEEKYRRLFPKMGRDFVHRDDFVRIIEQILDLVDPDRSQGIQPRDDTAALTRALEYRELLETGQDAPGRYRDLIDLEDT